MTVLETGLIIQTVKQTKKKIDVLLGGEMDGNI